MTTWSRVVRYAGMLLGSWLVACGEVPREEPPPDPHGEAFFLSYSEASCRWKARCGLVRDEGECLREKQAPVEKRRALGIPFPYLGTGGTSVLSSGSLRAGRIRFDEDRAEQCLQRLNDLSCEDELDAPSLVDLCNPYVGQRPRSAACLDTWDCSADAYCSLPERNGNACVAGQCVPNLEVGEQSIRSQQRCAPGLTSFTADRSCQPIPGEGMACESPAPCQEGLFCNRRTSTCQRKAKEGQACVLGEASCLSHLDCADDGRCHRRGNLGDVCTAENGSQFIQSLQEVRPVLHCKQGLQCAGANAYARGVCRELFEEGTSCLSVISNTCEPSLSCVVPLKVLVGTCRAPAQLGEACPLGFAYCDLGLWCDSKATCVAQGRKLGDACDSSSEYSAGRSCLSGFKCEDGRCVPSVGGTCEG